MADEEFRSSSPILRPELQRAKIGAAAGGGQRRKYVDFRAMTNLVGCSLAIAGQEEELLRAAVEHAISVHDNRNTPELHETIRRAMRDVPDGSPLA